jgi:hypothetical protein
MITICAVIVSWSLASFVAGFALGHILGRIRQQEDQ